MHCMPQLPIVQVGSHSAYLTSFTSTLLQVEGAAKQNLVVSPARVNRLHAQVMRSCLCIEYYRQCLSKQH